jgi:hypothetical protein
MHQYLAQFSAKANASPKHHSSAEESDRVNDAENGNK